MLKNLLLETLIGGGSPEMAPRRRVVSYPVPPISHEQRHFFPQKFPFILVAHPSKGKQMTNYN